MQFAEAHCVNQSAMTMEGYLQPQQILQCPIQSLLYYSFPLCDDDLFYQTRQEKPDLAVREELFIKEQLSEDAIKTKTQARNRMEDPFVTQEMDRFSTLSITEFGMDHHPDYCGLASSKNLGKHDYHKGSKKCEERKYECLPSELECNHEEIEALCNSSNVERSDVSNGHTENTEKRKCKKNKKRKLELMKGRFEKMVNRLLESQEILQNRFLDEIERKDRQRKEKEEVWKMEQITMLSKEAELQLQEQALAISRGAAIVSFIKNISTSKPSGLRISSSPSADAKAMLDEMDSSSENRPIDEIEALMSLRSMIELEFQETRSREDGHKRQKMG